MFKTLGSTLLKRVLEKYSMIHKYLEFTNSYIQNIEPPIGLPEAGEGAKVTYTIVGGADSVLTYSWTANEATDPSTHINHTDV